ncbi:MAG: molecular chaperone DnaJ [Chloroflexi bacterium]|mgnify:CR=1 FL=1|nr:molecular chaperone DnaJ [Chloroflexota bacterium]
MAPTKRDYYEVLGLSRNAGKDDIRSAYRRLARQYHPDVNKEAEAEDRFKEINEAYQILNDDSKRAAYDRYGHAGLNQSDFNGPGFGGFGDLGDIFEDLFGFGMRTSTRQGPRRGADLRYDMEITFEEAVFGVEKDITITRMEACPHCRGSGAEPGTTPTRCPECNGSGQIRRAQQSIFGSFVNVTTCPRCNGRGEVVHTPCSECHGAQRVERPRTLSISIPAGVDDGNRIRLTGEGEAGTYGGPAGNLYVVLHVREHPFFQRRENDIILTMNINVAQAALGDEIVVPTLEDEHPLNIPAGTQTGTIFRLKGEGVPRVHGNGRGDELVIVNVAVPTALTAEQKRLFSELGASLGKEVSPQEDKSFLDRVRDALGF